MLPLGLRRHPAEFLFEHGLVDLGPIDQAVVDVDAAIGLLDPHRPQRLHRIGVAVEIDDLLLVGRDAVARIGDHPDEIAERVEVDILETAHRLDLDDLLAKVVEPRELVIGGAAARVSALVGRTVDVIGRDADGLLEYLDRQGVIFGGQLGHARIEVGHEFLQ